MVIISIIIFIGKGPASGGIEDCVAPRMPADARRSTAFSCSSSCYNGIPTGYTSPSRTV